MPNIVLIMLIAITVALAATVAVLTIKLRRRRAASINNAYNYASLLASLPFAQADEILALAKETRLRVESGEPVGGVN